MIFKNIKQILYNPIKVLFHQNKNCISSYHNYRLIECEDLKSLLDSKEDLKLVYSYQAPIKNYKVLPIEHIQGSMFINLEEVQSKNNPSKHFKLPSDDQFTALMHNKGIRKNDKVIIYCNSITNSARLHWIMDIFGHQNLYYLNGGIIRWAQLGYPLQNEYQLQEQKSNNQEIEQYQLNKQKVTYLEEMIEINKNYDQNSQIQIVDTRRREQYVEGVNENWTHIQALRELVERNGRFISQEKFKEVIQKHKVDINKNIISVCKRGYQATLLNFLGYHTFQNDYKGKVYDGSWDEWNFYNQNQKI